MQTPTLLTQDLSLSRSNRLLFRSLNFQLQRGCLLQILGENGVGKTSLLKILAGLSRAEMGAVLFEGEDIQNDLAAYQKQLAYLGHRQALKLNLSVKENLQLTNNKLSLLDEFALSTHQDDLLAHLSQGQKQRVSLVRICASEKPIWILDEPFSALDQKAFDLFQVKLQSHLLQGGMVMMSSHRAVELTNNVQSLYLEKNHAVITR